MKASSFKELVEFIYSDYYRTHPHVPYRYNLKMALRLYKWGRKEWSFWFRCAQYKSWWQAFAIWRFRRISHQLLIEIPLKTDIGFGLYIGHPRCIVINEGTKIGNNVNLSQFLSIGTNNATPAVIGNNVYIGPMCCIVEDVHIGDNVTIGAGAVVVKDVEDNATVAGVPAHVLNYDNPGRFVNNRFVRQNEARISHNGS